MRIICIDPGIKSGIALFTDGTLEHAQTYIVGDAPLLSLPYADLAVLEIPEVYTGRSNPVAIVTLAICAGRWREAFAIAKIPQVRTLKPAQWKGQVPKDVHHARVRAALTLREASIVDAILPASTRHNALDAVGLGLVTLGRLR